MFGGNLNYDLIDERILQIRGSLNVSTDYQMGDDIKVIVSIDKIQHDDSHKGKLNKIFKAKLFEVEETLKEHK